MLTVSSSRAAAAAAALRPSGLLWRQMSMFESKWKKKKDKKMVIKYYKRTKPLPTDHDKDMPIFDYSSKNPMSRVYMWGMACYGALGVPEYLRPKRRHVEPLKTMHRPARCSFVETRGVSDVACGYGFTVFAVSPGNSKGSHIMGTGINKSGQLGYVAPQRGRPLEMLIQPLGVTLPVRSSKSRVVRVAAGREHTLALTNDGDVFSLGNNAYGQCGREVIEHEDYFHNRVVHKIKGPWAAEGDEGTALIQSVHCGQDHSLFRSLCGRVFSCGLGADGQTGLGHYQQTGEVAQVQGDIKGENIVKVATSADCVLALNDKGELFGWGNSEYGQFLSVTEEQQLSDPTSLAGITKGIGKVIDVACGGTVCIILNGELRGYLEGVGAENRDVFVWGYGILGKGPNLEYARTPSHLPNPLFGQNAFSSSSSSVRSVHAGVHTCAALTEGGALFMWGKNKGSCLGLGDYKDQFFPLRVSLLNEVSKVSLGVDHTAVMCKPLT